MSKCKVAATADLLPPEPELETTPELELETVPKPKPKPTPDEKTNNQNPPRPYTTNPVVTEAPATCPRCHSTKSKVTKSTPFPNRPIRIGDRTFRGSVLRRRTCAKCGRRYVSRAPLEE